MSRRPAARSPLPQREGVDATRVTLPVGGGWTTLGEHLRERLAAPELRAPGLVERLFDQGRVVDGAGRRLGAGTPYEPGGVVWVDRELAPEPRLVPRLEVLHRDDRLVVVDKPPFLASMPRGVHVTQTALARARHELDLPDLALSHRLDRLTSGVLVLVADPRLRGAYQELFARRAVTKTYAATAPVRRDLTLPTTVRSHLRKDRGVLRAVEVADLEPNAETRVELVAARDGRGLYRLHPLTGRTHQLRVQLAGLGIPVVGDPLYGAGHRGGPTALHPPDDLAHPLQLLALQLAFTDPVDGSPRVFRSRRTLAGWSAQELADVAGGRSGDLT